MNQNYENSAAADYVKIMREKNRVIDILLEKQKEYPADSLEYQSIKLAVAAIGFCVELLSAARPHKVLTERQQKKLAEVERLIEEEYREWLACGKSAEDGISLKDISKMIPCLTRLRENCEKNTEVFSALECSLKDIETAMHQKNRFLVFLKTV